MPSTATLRTLVLETTPTGEALLLHAGAFAAIGASTDAWTAGIIAAIMIIATRATIHLSKHTGSGRRTITLCSEHPQQTQRIERWGHTAVYGCGAAITLGIEPMSVVIFTACLGASSAAIAIMRWPRLPIIAMGQLSLFAMIGWPIAAAGGNSWSAWLWIGCAIAIGPLTRMAMRAGTGRTIANANPSLWWANLEERLAIDGSGEIVCLYSAGTPAPRAEYAKLGHGQWMELGAEGEPQRRPRLVLQQG